MISYDIASKNQKIDCFPLQIFVFIFIMVKEGHTQEISFVFTLFDEINEIKYR